MADTYIIRVDSNNNPIPDGDGNLTCDVHFNGLLSNDLALTVPPLDPSGNAWTSDTLQAFLAPQVAPYITQDGM